MSAASIRSVLATDKTLSESTRTRLEHALAETVRLEAVVAVQREALTAIQAKQPEMLETLRKRGVVFEDIGNDPENWQHVAFTIYTQLCEVETIARLALDDEGVSVWLIERGPSQGYG